MASDKIRELDSSKDCLATNKKILILSTERCGSTWFCEQLGGTALLGDPQEWLNPLFVSAYRNMHGNVSIGNYIGTIIRKSSSVNGVFSINIHISDYKSYADKGVNLLDIKFDHVIYLYRDNKVAQSVSHAMAAATGKWISEAKPLRSLSGSPKRSEIACALTLLLEQEEYYEQHLRKYVEAEFSYESFTGPNQKNIFPGVLKLLGEDPEKYIPSKTTMKIQRSSETMELYESFMQYLSG